MDEKRIAKLMKEFDCTREEAISVILEDEEVDKMDMKEVNSDLTADQKKAMKEATKTGTKRRTDVKRERKVDTEKLEILKICGNALESLVGECQYKTETELNFNLNGNEYTLKLIKHRGPKA